MATMKNKVIWQEGLFVKPQHFQQQQRHNDYVLQNRLLALSNINWGFTDLDIDETQLKHGKISINKAIGCMSDGTVFSIPDQDIIPAPLLINELKTSASREIYLALPIISDVINEVEGMHSAGQSSGRYRINYSDVRDLHTNEGDASALALGQLLPCLMSGAEDLSSWVTIPLCRIKERHPNGMLELDPEFIPSVMTTHSSTALTRYLGEVTSSVTNRAEELAKRIGAPSQQGIADVAEFMMLQMFNRNQTKFAHRSALARLHPEVFYLDLISLYGELVTFTEESRLSEKLGFYQQENLTETFNQIMPRLRKALSTVLAPRAMNLPFTYMDGIYAAIVNDSTLLQSATFVLAVKSQMPHETLHRQFVQQSKISSVEKIRNVVSVQVPGVQLVPLSTAPRQIPYHANYVYFTLDKNSLAWAEIVRHNGIALHVSGNFPELELQLWAIRG
ncbi:type VI secretion system protein ImpJ [Buttiauxella sp. BIGb0471]|uniref:type VI secretion system baseplate subunit TssK n=1 Tax=Buttiauxella sp. BIGb0471 TaxID=2940597 RepID=UPI002167FC6C|nr:type VI secretion system baseplate subunit TssK [Buttiauxella sp. BIGb0471]MCS3603957.1 type VI secretion system protein ImpJ [Buttiauxella sp. BIGb0471]